MTRSDFCNDQNWLLSTTSPMPKNLSLPANNTVSIFCSSETFPGLKKFWHRVSIFSKWRNSGPFHHISQLTKVFGYNNLVVTSTELVSVGTYIQYCGATFFRITWTRFLTQTLKSFRICLIYNSEICESDQPNYISNIQQPCNCLFYWHNQLRQQDAS